MDTVWDVNVVQREKEKRRNDVRTNVQCQDGLVQSASYDRARAVCHSKRCGGHVEYKYIKMDCAKTRGLHEVT